VFFGEPEFDTADLLRTDGQGRGVISSVELANLQDRPTLFSTFLMWLLADLFHELPEVGDLDKPKLVFFFDEAHLLFNDSPPALLQRVEQVVRIIRSKGVGVYFCSQFPDDIPNNVLGQLGNRIQHALRAFTPRDQKAVRTAAETFVANPKLDVATVISQLQVGEALVSMLLDKGVPMPVERTLMSPPRCRMGAITAEERAAVRGHSPVGAKYDTTVNRESAYEILSKRTVSPDAPPATAPPAATPAQGQAPAPDGKTAAPSGSSWTDMLWGSKKRQGMVETMAKQAARTVGSQVGRQILRGVLGGILGGTRRR
jgi:DNA helicase HerA-like ATPase